jgi:YfiH family protein
VEQHSTTKQPLFRAPGIFSAIPGLIAAESTRHGGVSIGSYSSLNLGGSTQDDPDHVTENNRRFFNALNVPLDQVAKSHQVHGTEILNVRQPGRYEGYDAMMTNLPDIQLAVTVADCTPILIYDPVTKAVAAIHAGWRGTVGEIVRKTVETMVIEFATKPEDCLAYVGTCIDECSFEVGEDVAQHFESSYKRWDAEKSKFFVDLKQANKDQLIRAGLKPEHVEVSRYSTVINNDDYFSYRRENGITGRMLATIGIKASY